MDNKQSDQSCKTDVNGSAVFHGDCLEIMKQIPDESIDMILCDLPYGTTACKWDEIIPFNELWIQYKRIIKTNGAIVLTASQPFTSVLVNSNLKMFKHEWIWKKNKGSNFANVKYSPFKEHESVLVFSKGKLNYYPIKEERSEAGKNRIKYDFNFTGGGETMGMINKHQKKAFELQELRYPSSVQKFNTESGLHPTQKPVKLFEYFIKTYTKKNDLVLDNCAGSGTTGIACINTNRNYILIEKEQKYIYIINNRISYANKIKSEKFDFEDEL